MLKKMLERVVIVTLLLSSVSAAPPITRSSTYRQESITPDISNWPQARWNWCGPATLQAAIDWVWRRYGGEPNMYTQQELWDYMKNNTCYDVGKGRDAALPGVVGDGNADVRKLNIAYDFGVDPHAIAWTMWNKAPFRYYYHYWAYDNVNDATRR